MSNVSTLNAWQSLLNRRDQALQKPIKELFEDKGRFNKYSLKVQNILLDYSKNPIDDDTLQDLLSLAKEADVENWRTRMFSGERINATENRAVLHTALRNRNNTPRLCRWR